MTRSAGLRAVAVSTLALAALLAAGSAEAETVLRLAHASSSASLINEAVTRFADEVAQKSNGALTIQIFPDAQLGDEGPIADGVGAGSIDIGLGGVVDAIDPKLNVVTLPFLFADAAAALQPFARGEVQPAGYRQHEAQELLERIARRDAVNGQP